MGNQTAPGDIVEMHAIISGRVHGVGFRATAQYFADQLGIKGTVRNMPDGTVEIYAQGSRGTLDELILMLRENVGHVDSVKADYSEPKHHFDSFRITY